MIYKVKIIIKSQEANPKPPIGSVLGQKGINVSSFCKEFNELTKTIKKGTEIPTLVVIKKKKFKIFLKSPTTTFLLKKYFKKGLIKDIKNINDKILDKIFNIKKNDLNCFNKSNGYKIIKGSAKSFFDK
ncbi:50S ribosomal protein L11 [Candidatus Vidania fulgoroideorum]